MLCAQTIKGSQQAVVRDKCVSCILHG